MKKSALWLALGLLLAASALLLYRIVGMGYPILPAAPGQTWQLAIQAQVKAKEGEVGVSLGLPVENPSQMLVEERFASRELVFDLRREGPNRIGIWSGSLAAGSEEILYRTTILVRPRAAAKAKPPNVQPYPEAIGRDERTLVERIVRGWASLMPRARFRAVAAAAAGVWEGPGLKIQDQLAWSAMQKKYGRTTALLALFRAADLPAFAVEGLRLEGGIWNRPVSWIEVWAGGQREGVNPETGQVEGHPLALLPLATGGTPAFQITGGEGMETRWTLTRQVMSHWRFHFERIQRSDRFLDRWSLFQLPPEFQQTFHVLLLVPIGALMVGGLRNLIGFPTFGIFMPVLMALAFRMTGLGYGLGIFAGVLLLGYAVRSRLDKLRLLLVPRMSVMLTLVIACFTLLALIGAKAGMPQLMAVGFLPFVILTMVIERFFVIVEEAGVGEGVKTAAGTAAVSMLTYAIISWEPLQLTFFVYPELLAAVAAVQILLGRYSGFRLSELIRFRALGGRS